MQPKHLQSASGHASDSPQPAESPATKAQHNLPHNASPSAFGAAAPLPDRQGRLELVFSLRAWLKLQFLCHIGETEIGAFAITLPGQPLYVDDLVVIRQTCSVVTVEFDDQSVADFFEDRVDQGQTPEQFARIWMHTHPGASPEPSGTDEQTFARVFGRCGWAVMFILARGGAVYCRLQVTAERAAGSGTPGQPIRLSQQIPVRVDYAELARGAPSLPTDDWLGEYTHNVQVQPDWNWREPGIPAKHMPRDLARSPDQMDAYLDWFDELEPEEQELFLEHANASWRDEDPRSWELDDYGIPQSEVSHED